MATTSQYTFTLRVFPPENVNYFDVERTVWGAAAGGTWRETDGEYLLTLRGNGACGTVRFNDDTGENFVVALGVHGYKIWCDIVPDVEPLATGSSIQAEYFLDNEVSNSRASKRVTALSSSCNVESKSGKYSIKLTAITTPKNLRATVRIEREAQTTSSIPVD